MLKFMQVTGTVAACWVCFANVVLVLLRDPQKNTRWPTVKCAAGNCPQAAMARLDDVAACVYVDQLQRAAEHQEGQLRANNTPAITSFSASHRAPGV